MFKKILNVILIACFSLTTLGPIPQAHADSVLNLPVPGTMVLTSPNFEPALIRGLTVHKDNPFLFDFIVDPGQSKLSGQSLKDESDRMIKYFFASLTIPDKDIWVNLSPYEKDRMIPTSLGLTAMGRDLLAQDYMLKQLTASLIYPQKALGKEFWDRVYSKAKEMYGTTSIPVNTFNKVWIVPQKAGIYEHGQTAFIVDAHLKVMLEEDYLSLTKHDAILNPVNQVGQPQNQVHKIGSQIIRAIILPEIEREVNDGKNFATLRQIFYSQVLAVWFKRNLKQALINRVYANKGTVKGIDQNDAATNEEIYQQYLKAYKKGVFNFIKDDIDPVSQQALPRKYFSGGYGEAQDMAVIAQSADQAQSALEDVSKNGAVDFAVSAVGSPEFIDEAMTSAEIYHKLVDSSRNAFIQEIRKEPGEYNEILGRESIINFLTDYHGLMGKITLVRKPENTFAGQMSATDAIELINKEYQENDKLKFSLLQVESSQKDHYSGFIIWAEERGDSDSHDELGVGLTGDWDLKDLTKTPVGARDEAMAADDRIITSENRNKLGFEVSRQEMISLGSLGALLIHYRSSEGHDTWTCAFQHETGQQLYLETIIGSNQEEAVEFMQRVVRHSLLPMVLDDFIPMHDAELHQWVANVTQDVIQEWSGEERQDFGDVFYGNIGGEWGALNLTALTMQFAKARVILPNTNKEVHVVRAGRGQYLIQPFELTEPVFIQNDYDEYGFVFRAQGNRFLIAAAKNEHPPILEINGRFYDVPYREYAHLDMVNGEIIKIHFSGRVITLRCNNGVISSQQPYPLDAYDILIFMNGDQDVFQISGCKRQSDAVGIKDMLGNGMQFYYKAVEGEEEIPESIVPQVNNNMRKAVLDYLESSNKEIPVADKEALKEELNMLPSSMARLDLWNEFIRTIEKVGNFSDVNEFILFLRQLPGMGELLANKVEHINDMMHQSEARPPQPVKFIADQLMMMVGYIVSGHDAMVGGFIPYEGSYAVAWQVYPTPVAGLSEMLKGNDAAMLNDDVLFLSDDWLESQDRKISDEDKEKLRRDLEGYTTDAQRLEQWRFAIYSIAYGGRFTSADDAIEFLGQLPGMGPWLAKKAGEIRNQMEWVDLEDSNEVKFVLENLGHLLAHMGKWNFVVLDVDVGHVLMPKKNKFRIDFKDSRNRIEGLSTMLQGIDAAMVVHLPREYSARPMTEELISYLGYQGRFSEFVDFIGGKVEGWEYLRANTWDAFITIFRTGKPSWRQVENSLSAIDELSSRLRAEDTVFIDGFRRFLREYNENDQAIKDQVRRSSENIKTQQRIHIWSMKRIAKLGERLEGINIEDDRTALVALYERRLKILQENIGLLEQLHGEAFGRVREKIEELVSQGPQENLRDMHRFNLFYMDQIYLYWVMANLRVSNGWSLPEFVNEPGLFDAPDMVNPFLDEGQVKNSVLLTPEAPFEIELGPNASGKSTLLKSIAFFAVFSRLGLCVPSPLKVSKYDDIEIRVPGTEGALPSNKQTLSIIDEGFPVDVDFLTEAKRAIENKTSVIAATHHQEAVDALLADDALKGHIKAVKMLTTVSEGELTFHYRLVPYHAADSDVSEHSLLEARKMLKKNGFESLFDAADTFIKGGALSYPKQEFHDDSYREWNQGEEKFFQYLKASSLIDGHYFAFDFALPEDNFDKDIYHYILLGGINFLSEDRYFEQINTKEIVEHVSQIRQRMTLPQLQQLHQLIKQAVAIIKNEPTYSEKWGTIGTSSQESALSHGDELVLVVKKMQDLLNTLGVDLYKEGFEQFLQDAGDGRNLFTGHVESFFTDTLRLLDIINGFAIAVDEKGLTLPQKGKEADVLDIQGTKFNLKIHLGQTNVVTADSPGALEESLKTTEKIITCISHGFFVPARSVVYGEHFEHLKPSSLYMQTIRDSKGLSFFQTLLFNLSSILSNVLYKRNDFLIIDGLYGSNQTMMDILNTMLAIFTGDTKKTMILGTYQTGWAKRLEEKGAPLNIQNINDADAAMLGREVDSIGEVTEGIITKIGTSKLNEVIDGWPPLLNEFSHHFRNGMITIRLKLSKGTLNENDIQEVKYQLHIFKALVNRFLKWQRVEDLKKWVNDQTDQYAQNWSRYAIFLHSITPEDLEPFSGLVDELNQLCTRLDEQIDQMPKDNGSEIEQKIWRIQARINALLPAPIHVRLKYYKKDQEKEEYDFARDTRMLRGIDDEPNSPDWNELQYYIYGGETHWADLMEDIEKRVEGLSSNEEWQKLKSTVDRAMNEKSKRDSNFIHGGIDLSQQDSAMRVTKDANGGVKVDVDQALIARVEREGISEVDPVIIGMRPADIQAIFGVKILTR